MSKRDETDQLKSIPLARVDASDTGGLPDGHLSLLAGFGAGMTWGSALNPVGGSRRRMMRWGTPWIAHSSLQAWRMKTAPQSATPTLYRIQVSPVK